MVSHPEGPESDLLSAHEALERADQRTAPAFGVLRGSPFRLYWTADAVSSLGDAVSVVVIPIIAVANLGASTSQMAFLWTAILGPRLVLQIPLAMWADSLRSRVSIMVAIQTVLAAVVAMVPVLWWTDLLSFNSLLVILSLKAIANACLAAVSSPMLVSIVSREHIVTASGRLNGTRSATSVAGGALGGGLLAFLAAPVVLVVDAASFVASAGVTSRIRALDARASPAGPYGSFSLSEIKRIARRLAQRPELWCLVAIAAVNAMCETVFAVFAIRTLNVPASRLGLFLALGAVGGVLGGFVAGKMSRVLARGTIVVSILAMIGSIGPLAFVESGTGAALAIVNYELVGAFGGTIALAFVLGRVQASAADGAVSRNTALAQNSLHVAALAGIFLGGVVARMSTARTPLVLGFVLLSIAAIPLMAWVLRSREPLHPDGEEVDHDVQAPS